jgi:hypothetical protein
MHAAQMGASSNVRYPPTSRLGNKLGYSEGSARDSAACVQQGDSQVMFVDQGML